MFDIINVISLSNVVSARLRIKVVPLVLGWFLHESSSVLLIRFPHLIAARRVVQNCNSNFWSEQ